MVTWSAILTVVGPSVATGGVELSSGPLDRRLNVVAFVVAGYLPL